MSKELELERDQLKARVAELEIALEINHREAMYGVNGEESPFICCNSIAKTAVMYRNRQPAQSLDGLRAQVLREFADSGAFDGCAWQVGEMLIEEANRLEQGDGRT